VVIVNGGQKNCPLYLLAGYMKQIVRLGIINIMMFGGLSCTTHLSPRELDIQESSVPTLQNIKPVTIRAKLVGSKERVLPLAGADVIVNEDEFTEVLVERLIDALQNNNVPVTPESDRLIEIQVARVSLQPDRTFYCVIDFNRKLGKGSFYGFQSISKNWNFKTACEDALKNTVTDILNDQDTIKYLKGE
jgi:hypothetical protein